MKLAFSGEGRYPEFAEGYKTYCSRRRGKPAMSEEEYRRVVKRYCQSLADRLYEDGMVDLPSDLGTIATVLLTRRPQYRGKQFVGYGKKDWGARGQYDGNLKAFGITFLPKRKIQNLRCYGFVANRRLFQKVKERYMADGCPWTPLAFKDEMI